ncbi:MAG TPA: hypothetical protein VLE23_10430 [Geminicoccaceae bacterium]|nr:hypothetical protein [Geminicoccaceae bacterium]
MSYHQLAHLAIFGLSLTAILTAAGASAAGPASPTFSIDVVADCNRLITNGTPQSASPALGDSFMQQGLIYRPGTLVAHCPNGDGCGLNPDGTPEFPDEVIGKWTYWGSFIGIDEATEPGVWLHSTQVYEFGATEIGEYVFEPVTHVLASDGRERIDLRAPFNRAITGGSGRFEDADGEITQIRIGLNQTKCENFTFEFNIRPRLTVWSEAQTGSTLVAGN